MFSVYTHDGAGTNTLFTEKPAGSFGGSLVPVGEPGTADYRLHFKDQFGNPTSPWHKVRLHTAMYGVLNCVIEIPKMTSAKLEVSLREEQNPIAYAGDSGKLQCFHKPIRWNYGFLPETWSDPQSSNSALDKKGDNRPLDVVEIGSAALPTGSVVAVKPLGALAMLKGDIVDWKIIALSTQDPLAKDVHDLDQLEAAHPEVIGEICEWFESHIAHDEMHEIAFGYEGKAVDRAETNSVISAGFDAWRALRAGKVEGNNGLWCENIHEWTDGLV